MKILANHSLKALNTFGIDVIANQFFRAKSRKDLIKVAKTYRASNIFVLGGGSNILLTRNITKFVVHNQIKGIEIEKEDQNHVWVKFGAGEVWHDCVLWAIENGYGGIENLSLIPGYMGAAPIQNIGAYGVELKDVFESLDLIRLDAIKAESYAAEACQFGYRDSIFKRELKGKFCISHVYLKLTKTNHQLNISYGAITSSLAEKGISNPTIKDISDVVIAIRKSKLPDPKEIGNSGSFFKNPVLSKEKFLILQEKYPDVVFYEQADNTIKVPAGWLIEKCGWKGRKVGNTGTHINQALVLVNYGDASGEEVKQMALKIQDSVQKKYNVLLEMEVNII